MNVPCKNTLIAFAVFLFLISCKEDQYSGINPSLMDLTTSPKEDFFQYANGSWLDNNEIPANRTRWGSLDEVRSKTNKDVLRILTTAINTTNLDLTTSQGKAVVFFKTILNTDARNASGIQPLQPYLEKIDAIATIGDLQQFMMDMEVMGGLGFFSFDVRADAKDSNKNVVYLGSGSLGLPDRDYYIQDNADAQDKRARYVNHISNMLQFLGDTQLAAAKNAKRILAFEQALALPRMDKVDRRDARKRYNPRTISELQEMVPAIDWKNYFDGIGMATVKDVIVSQLKYIKAVQDILKKGNVADWKLFLKWSLLNWAANMLSEEIETESWKFYGKTLKGAKTQGTKEQRALTQVNKNLGEALGQLYVAEKFPPEAKVKAQKMIKNVLKAFENSIKRLAWMGKETKLKAIEKLQATTVKVAYPDTWKDYSELNIQAFENGGSYFQNIINIATWNFQEDLKKLGKPVDKSVWHMAPQVVNAYFNPAYNEIVFPAAILQAPFYNYTADEAVNYGAIGAVIGHEISHSFDDSGAQFDKDGNLNNWWTAADLSQFEILGSALADQYAAIEVLPGVHINGKFTLGENIGDLGGINAAYDGLKLHFEQEGKPTPIDGFTAEQRFFLSWATIWRTKYRDTALKNQIKTDPHAPGMIRAVQPLRNIDAFYEAFAIEAGDAMYLPPEQRVKIW